MKDRQTEAIALPPTLMRSVITEGQRSVGWKDGVKTDGDGQTDGCLT